MRLVYNGSDGRVACDLHPNILKHNNRSLEHEIHLTEEINGRTHFTQYVLEAHVRTYAQCNLQSLYLIVCAQEFQLQLLCDFCQVVALTAQIGQSCERFVGQQLWLSESQVEASIYAIVLNVLNLNRRHDCCQQLLLCAIVEHLFS